MSHSSDGIITPEILHDKYNGDPQIVLGEYSEDLSVICTAANINKWSKHKPIKFQDVTGVLSAANWIAANYGIKDIPTWTRLDYMATFLMSAARGALASTYWPECDIIKGSLSIEYWTLDQPDGTIYGPYRTADFDGYWHYAEQPVGNMQVSSINITPDGVLQISFPKCRNDISNQLQLDDFTYPGTMSQTVANMYFGVLMQKTSGGTTYASLMMSGSSYVKVGDVASARNYVIEIPLTASQAWMIGQWKIYPIISNVTFPQLTTNLSQYNSNKFIAPLPYHGQTISIGIQYAELTVTSHHGYKDGTSQQRYARFNFQLANSEPSGAYRNFRVDVTICDSAGTQLYSLEGSTTGQVSTGSTTAATVSIYIAGYWNRPMYYKAEVSVTDSVTFKRTNYVSLTGPIEVETPTPD